MTTFKKTSSVWIGVTARLNSSGQWLPSLFLRLILFWEFWEAGLMKKNGSNWFGSIQDNFPFPFNIISTEASWFMATWGEIIFAVFLLLGLFTRFSATALLVITAVATAAVHWPSEWNSLSELWQGYAISDKGFGNFKLPLLYMLMLFPLIFSGAGKFSLDQVISKLAGFSYVESHLSDHFSTVLAVLVIALPIAFLMPLFAGALMLIATLFLVIGILKQ